MDLWKSFLAVGMGGFVGACMRYGIGMITVKSDFPVTTFIINILGAILIGIVAELASQYASLPALPVLFFKTGVCGGFTTFSTFSLENMTLIENDKIFIAGAYAISSVICCIVGVYIGKLIVRTLLVH